MTTTLSASTRHAASSCLPLIIGALLVTACSSDSDSDTDTSAPTPDATSELDGFGDTSDTDVDGTDALADADGSAQADAIDGDTTDTGTDVVGDASPADGSASADVDATSSDDVLADGDAEAEACTTWPRTINADLYGPPARCGQEAFDWIDSEQLGEIVGTVDSTFFAAALLEGVLASEGVTLPAPLLYDARVEQITYLTQDRGELIEATGLVAWPAGAGDEPLQMVVLLHGTSGFSDGCGTSGELEWRALAGLFASLGFGVVSPDYIGLRTDEVDTGFLHPYLVHQPTAISALDMLRAFPRIEGTPCMGNEILAFGGSQGGHAALWVERLLPYYASEFELLGTVATVPPMDLVGQVELALAEVRNSTANTIAFFSTAPAWYGFADQATDAFLAPFATDIPAALDASCNPGSALDEPETLGDLFTESLLDAVQGGNFDAFDPWYCITADSSLVDTTVARINEDSESYGILVITGGRDNLVDTPNERAAFETLCEAGLPMEYIECQDSSHTGATFDALNDILAFTLARAAREPWVAPETCDAPAARACTRD